MKGSQKIQNGSYGAVEHRNFAQNKKDDTGYKQVKTHDDYTLNQGSSGRKDGLTKGTRGEYLLQDQGGTVLVFFSLMFQNCCTWIQNQAKIFTP